MKRYPRILRTFKNPFRAVRRTRFSYKRRFNRIQRRALRRRPQIPEIKFVENGLLSNAWADRYITNPCTPLSITQGTGRNNRIGANVRFRRVVLRLMIQGPYSSLPGTIVNNPDYLVRIIISTPRLDYTSFKAYLDSFTAAGDMYKNLDTNYLTVFMDKTVHIGVAQIASYNVSGALNGAASTSPVPHYFFTKKTFTFPRKVRFSTTSDLIDEEKDSLYITLLKSSDTSFSYQWYAKTTFTDN